MRPTSPITIAAGSLVVLVALLGALWLRERPERERPLIVYAAPTSRLPLEVIATDYERETGQRVELRIGPSEDVLTKVRFSGPTEPADLFIPADDSYIHQAREFGLVAETVPVARIRAVLLISKGNPKGIAAWRDLLAPGVRVAVPNPAAAVGKLAREHLATTGHWAALKPHVVDVGNVTDAANATRAGDEAATDAAIVWDAVAAGPAFKEQTVLSLPELNGVTARVEIAVLNQSRDVVAARALAKYIVAPDKGLRQFRAFGFRIEEAGGAK